MLRHTSPRASSSNNPFNRPSAVGKALAETKRTLIYGGGSGGIMGAVSGAVLDAGGEVTGVVPYAMVAAGGEVDQTKGKRGPAVLLNEKGRERVRFLYMTGLLMEGF